MMNNYRGILGAGIAVSILLSGCASGAASPSGNAANAPASQEQSDQIGQAPQNGQSQRWG